MGFPQECPLFHREMQLGLYMISITQSKSAKEFYQSNFSTLLPASSILLSDLRCGLRIARPTLLPSDLTVDDPMLRMGEVYKILVEQLLSL